MGDILGRIVTIFFSFLNLSIFVVCLLSWIPGLRNSPLYSIFSQITEPILYPVRRLFNNSPIGGSGVDFSPIIALIFLSIVENILLGFIRNYF